MNAQRLFLALVVAMPLQWLCSARVAGAGSADGEDAQAAGPMEEVVVSEFRSQAVADVDSSITVLNREVVEAAALQHFEELVSLVPNMNFSGEGSRARYFQLRGVGELEQYEGAPNPSIGFIVDDIDLSGVGGITTVFDIDRVEVLRGPQAARFGASALAGLVYVQSAAATPEFDLRAEAVAGSDAARALGVAVGGGLAPNLAGRASLHHYESDGFYRNVSLGRDDSNGRDETVARGRLAWDFGSGWAGRLSLLYVNFDNGYDAWSPENGRITFSDHPGRDEQETAGGSLRLEGPLGEVAKFVSISGYASTDVLFSYDGEWGDADYWAPYVYDFVYSDARGRDALTQEFRLLSMPAGRLFGGRSDWVLGLYFQRLEESDDILSAGIYDDSADAPYSFCTPCLADSTLRSDFTSRNYALFARLDSELSPSLSLDVGLRMERWEADYSDAFVDRVYGEPARPVEHDFHPSDSLWGGDVSLNYELDGGSRVWLLASRGYKGGGFNPSLARVLQPGDALGPEAIAFGPESLLNYEAGFRALWLDGRLSLDAALFYMDREDMQVRSSAQFTDNPNDFIFVTSNAQGHALGAEASVSWQVSDGWRLFGALGLLDTEIDEYGLKREAGIEGDLTGRAFAHAPRWTLNAGASYLSNNGWLARIDVNSAGSFYFDYSHDEKAGGRTVVNLRLGREWPHWSVYAWVRNLFDEDYETRGFSFGLAPPLFARTRYTRLGDPRQIGLTVRYRF